MRGCTNCGATRHPIERRGHAPARRADRAPRLAGFDGAAVAAQRDYMAQDAKLAAHEFAAARAGLVALLAATTPSDMGREATFMDAPVTLERLVGMMVEHDREHREEIGALRDALEDRSWK